MEKRRYRYYKIDYRTYNYTLKKYHNLHREIYAENARDAVKMLKSKECNREFEIVKVYFVDIFGDRNDRFYPRTYVIDKEDFSIWTSISKLYTAGGTLYFNGKKVLLEG